MRRKKTREDEKVRTVRREREGLRKERENGGKGLGRRMGGGT